MAPRWILALVFAAVASAAAAAPVRSAGPETLVYAVKKGDTLYDLARHYLVPGVDARALGRMNRITNPRRIPVGRKLTIPLALVRFEPIDARLSAYSGAVTVTGDRAGSVRRDMMVREGFELATGANAFLTIELTDGSRTTMPSQSRLRIERLRRYPINGAVQRDFRLIEGRSTSTVTPFTDPLNRFRILTPLTVAAVRGTEFRVTHDGEIQHSTVEVIEGRVGDTPTGGATETPVAAGFGAATTPKGQNPVQALLPRPQVQNAGQLQDEPRVAFTVEPREGAVAYRAQIAKDAGFIDILSEATTKDRDLGFEGIGDGALFARFTALDADGLEGLPAIYGFQRRLIALGLETPQPGARVRGKAQYRFKWHSADPAAIYRFWLSRDPQGRLPMIDEPGLTGREIMVGDLPKGQYVWRVQITVSDHGQLIDKWSPAQHFEIAG